MTRFTTTVAATAALLLSGAAFAQMPVSGEGPLFQNNAQSVSTVSRAQVQAEAAQKMKAGLLPSRHEFDRLTLMPLHSDAAQTRAEVRQETREAIAHGYRVKSGEQS